MIDIVVHVEEGNALQIVVSELPDEHLQKASHSVTAENSSIGILNLNRYITVPCNTYRITDTCTHHFFYLIFFFRVVSILSRTV